jgi:hypothetical protein
VTLYWAWRCTSRPDQASSLSLAMGLTTIVTTISVDPPKYLRCEILIFKENWTSMDVLGHAPDVWGQEP